MQFSERLRKFFSKTSQELEGQPELTARLDDERYATLEPDKLRLVDKYTSQGKLVAVRATQILTVDRSYQKYQAQYLEFGHLHPFISGNLSDTSPFIGKTPSTNHRMVIAPDALGVIEHVEDSFIPRRLGIYWEGFGPNEPGKFAWLPTVSLHPNEPFEVKVLMDQPPDSLNLTVHEIIKAHSRHPKYK